MERSRTLTTQTVLTLGAVLLAVGFISGCTHWGGTHGGHPSIWGGVYGGCELEYPMDAKRNYGAIQDPQLDLSYPTKADDEKLTSNDSLEFIGRESESLSDRRQGHGDSSEPAQEGKRD